MIRTMIIDNVKYEEILILPRWAYLDEEWLDVKLLADKVIDGVYYQAVIEDEDPFAELLESLL